MDKPLDNPINWSFRLGRVFAITIRMHVLFILGAVVILSQALADGSEAGLTGLMVLCVLGTYAILFGIVLLHEFGHCWGARRSGGEADEILIWPLGGLAYTNPPHTPRAHLVTTLAGPMVNVIICAITALVLVVWTRSLWSIPLNPFYPFHPIDMTLFPMMASARWWVVQAFGLSYILLVVNLFPIFPFDGGRVLQALLWPKKGYERSMEIATGVGMVGAIVIGGLGLLSSNWILLGIAVFGYMTCWQNRRMIREMGAMGGGSFGYDFSKGYDTFGDAPERKPGFFQRRRARREAAKTAKEEQQARAHAQRVEEVLRKISELGIDSLSRAERRTLEEETRRQKTGAE